MEAGLPKLGVPHFFLSKCYASNASRGIACEKAIGVHELIGTNGKAFLSSINIKLVETLKWEN